MQIPGSFARGNRVPPADRLRRVGRRGGSSDETLRSSLGIMVRAEIDAAGIAPSATPRWAIGDIRGEGEALTFSIESGVRPHRRWVRIGPGGRSPQPEIDEGRAEGEVDGLRERLAGWRPSTATARRENFRRG